MSDKYKGFLALLVCSVIFASFSIWVRLLGRDLLPYQQIGFRNGIALVISLMTMIFFKQSFRSISKVSLWWLTAYTVTFPIAVVLYTLSVLQTKIITTIFGLYLGSLVTSLVIGIFFFKEKITQGKVLSLGLVVTGLVVYIYPFDSNFFSIGIGLALLSGVFDALANSFRKFLAGKIDRFVLVALQMIGGLVVAIGLMSLYGQLTLPVLSPLSWIVGGIFGLSLVVISLLTLIGFSKFDLNLGTIVLSSELFFASIFGLLIFGEKATITELVGGTLILIATALANLEAADFTHFYKKITATAQQKKL